MGFKLDTINDNLALTGNNLCNTEEDGSDEWTVGSVAYETAVKHLLGAHDWKFATAITSPSRTGDSDDENYTDAYAKPAGTLGLVWVKVNGLTADWRIVGNQIYINADEGVTVKYVREPDPEEWPPLFNEILNTLVKAGLYEGLNEDPAEAARQRQLAEVRLAQARSRTDREEAPRAMFRSTILRRRRGEIITR